MTDPARRHTRAGPALAVQVLLAVSFGATLLLPIFLTRPPSPALTVAFVLGVVAYAVSLLGVLRGTLAPEPGTGLDRWAVPTLIVLTLVLWAPMGAWARDGQSPWGWLAGMTIAACALVGRLPGVVATGVLGAAALAAGAVFDQSVTALVLTVLGCALTLWAMCQVVVWLLRLLVAADAERSAQAELAVAQERLRVSRELHDVLGHRLGIITLKAELTADLAGRDPGRAATEAGEIQRLAAETLAESRRAIHAEETADLAAQLGAAELVLASAGIETNVEADQRAVRELPDELSHLLAAVVREAVTNILRHADAHQVRIALTGTGEGSRPSGILRIVNDGVRAPGPAAGEAGGGTGLAALSARCSAAGGRLVAGPTGEGTFEVRVELPVAGGGR